MINSEPQKARPKVDRLVAVTNVLVPDVDRCLQMARNSANSPEGFDPFWARALLRAFFALVEAATYEMCLLIEEAHRNGTINLSEAELGSLSEHTWELDDKGVPRKRSRFVQIARRVRFTFPLFGRIYGLTLSLPTDGYGWKCFGEAIQLRNRLLHPKDPSSLELSAPELTVAIEAISWYSEVHTQQLSRILAQIHGERAHL